MTSKSTSTREIAHLLRRTGFGPSRSELDSYAALGFERAVDRLVSGLAAPPSADPPGFSVYAPGAAAAAWVDRMRTSASPLAEKLALFWHGHFATSVRKVEDPKLMWKQVALFRSAGAGTFPALVASVSRDPAMIRWLDGNSNRKGAPNENYARELMELFTIGRGNYTERDVREAARAFTGWGAESGVFKFRQEYHDPGPKTVLGETGAFDGDDIVRIVTSRPECARFISRKLVAFLSHPEPQASDVAAAAAVFTKSKGSIADVVRHILLAPAFRSDASYRALIKSPAEFVVGALKVAGIGATPSWAVESMGRMGQTLFAPPTVKGWDGGGAWLSAGALLERMRFAARLAAEARAVDETIGLAFDGRTPAEVAGVLASAGAADRVTLALASPEFQLN
ncbi:MAG: DUF1800 domain-containing protein [Acidobacteria bacterium]|nr:DUF1800 domain-containing protein [Acidobacteriota bacterium]